MDAEPPLSGFLPLTELLILMVISWHAALLGLLLLVLLCCSALISGSEVAFFSLDPRAIDALKSEKSKLSARILHLRSMPRRLLATILITNNLVNIAIVLVSAILISLLLPVSVLFRWAESVRSLPVIGSFPVSAVANGIQFLITVGGVTFLLVLFGEVVPKVYAKLNNRRFANIMARPLEILIFILGPVSTIMVRWTKSLEHRIQRRSANGSAGAAIREEIDKAIDLVMPRDAGSRIEADILKSIVKFNEVSVKQIMRSRVDVVALDDEMTFVAIKNIIRKEGFSRLPVYRENLDNVTGVLYVKDLIGYIDRDDDFHWQSLVRPQILYVPESKKINELLKEFQREHNHLGIVVDEYGGTAGLVTLEDVMEEVIGEIKDEFDESGEPEYRRIDAKTFLFDGKMLLNDMCRIIGMESSKLDDLRGNADSLAGLILELSGKIPDRGEEFNIPGLTITVIAVSKRRIEKVRVQLKDS